MRCPCTPVPELAGNYCSNIELNYYSFSCHSLGHSCLIQYPLERFARRVTNFQSWEQLTEHHGDDTIIQIHALIAEMQQRVPEIENLRICTECWNSFKANTVSKIEIAYLPFWSTIFKESSCFDFRSQNTQVRTSWELLNYLLILPI